jgi:dTDP-4-dehydrorhamnose reductase
MKIAVTGASGMLGTSLIEYLSKKYKVFGTSRFKGLTGESINWDCFDLTNINLLENWLKKVKPDLVIHCAAIVDVDFCEKNIFLAKNLHVETTRAIANYLDLNNARLIYISTDSVFDGKKNSAYDENDPENPLNVYSKTKLLGEKIAQSINNSVSLRTNIVGYTRHGSSFAEWILNGLINNEELNLFHDVYFSPLNVYDLTLIIEKIIQNPIYGLFHCTSRDSISKYDYGEKMSQIFQLPNSNLNKVTLDNIKLNASRPKNMALDIKKISISLDHVFPAAIDSIKLMKFQYDNEDKLIHNYFK